MSYTTEEYRSIILDKIKSLEPNQYVDDYVEVISNYNLDSDAATQDAIRNLYVTYKECVPVPSKYQDKVTEDLIEEPSEEPQGVWNKFKSKMGW